MKNNYFLIMFLCILGLCSCEKSHDPVAAPQVDVYVVGGDLSGVNGKRVAKYWKNGIPVNLTDGSKHAFAHSITVSGNDVYVAGGEENESGVQIGKYWKNGVPVSLTDGSTEAEANSIVVSGDDVYVAGNEGVGNHVVAKY